MIENDGSRTATKNVTEQTEEYLKNKPWEIGDIYEIKPMMFSETTNIMVELEYNYVVLHDIYVTTSKTVHEDGKYEMIVMDVRFSNGIDSFIILDVFRNGIIGNGSDAQYSCPECSGDIDVLDNNYPIIECSECGWKMNEGTVVS